MLYFHIPYCKQACHYCDFHFSTNQSNIDTLVNALVSELMARADYLSSKTLESIYFGGGTPSLLNEKHLEIIFQNVHSKFNLSDTCEITLEANPDDINAEFIKMISKFGINRLSIGIQSFNEGHLKYMNRAHNASQATESVSIARDGGIENISLDLIYGLPAENHFILKADMNAIINLAPNHISAYCLTIEEKTVFGKWLKTNKIPKQNEQFLAAQFDMVMQHLKDNGYEQYEISNYAKENSYAKHNTAYWQGAHYLGIGPSAHSYNGTSRQFNVSNNIKYINALQHNKDYFEIEQLSEYDAVNELVMTAIRTKWGVEKSILPAQFFEENNKTLLDYIKADMIVDDGKTITLTSHGKHIADKITADLFLV